MSQPVYSNYSLEITGKDIGQIGQFRQHIPAATPINIAFLGNESHEQRIHAARTIREHGFEPVPIISSRRIRSRDDLDNLLEALMRAAKPRRFIFVGGDPKTPAGPYSDSLKLLGSGVLERHAIRHVGIVGYPEGHPRIEDGELWRALQWKTAFLADCGCSVEITTQFGFDADAIAGWIDRLRASGIDAPVRIGVPGPATVARLLRFAAQFGVLASSAVAARYGFSLTNLIGQVGPDLFFSRLSEAMSKRDMGAVLFHVYPFGGIGPGVDWMNRHAGNNSASADPEFQVS